VQGVGFAAIIHWGQEYTFEHARHGENYLEELSPEGQTEKRLGLSL
jgi:hypothetical protein